MTDAAGALRTRVVAASIIAPLVTVPVLLAVSLVVGHSEFDSVAEGLRGTLHAGFFFAFFGLPVAYAVEGTLMVCTILVGGAPTKTSPRRVMLTATIAGAVTMFFLWIGFFNSTEPWIVPIGAGMGFGSGATFIVVRDGVDGLRSTL